MVLYQIRHGESAELLDKWHGIADTDKRHVQGAATRILQHFRLCSDSTIGKEFYLYFTTRERLYKRFKLFGHCPLFGVDCISHSDREHLLGECR